MHIENRKKIENCLAFLLCSSTITKWFDQHRNCLRTSCTPALYERHWLPIQSQIQFKLCLLIHQVIGGRSPRSWWLRSVSRQELDVPRTRLVSSERAFNVVAPKAWNRLPVHIKSTWDSGLFKKQLKTFFIYSAWPIYQQHSQSGLTARPLMPYYSSFGAQGICLWRNQAVVLLPCWTNNHYPMAGLNVVINLYKLALLPNPSIDKAFQ